MTYVIWKSVISFILHLRMYSPPNYTKAMESSPMDIGENDAQHFPTPCLQMHSPPAPSCPCQPSATLKGYHYHYPSQYSVISESSWTATAVTASVKEDKRRG